MPSKNEINVINFSKDFIVIIDEDEKYEIYTKDGKRANDIEYDNVSYRTKYIEKEQYLLVEESGKEYYIDNPGTYERFYNKLEGIFK